MSGLAKKVSELIAGMIRPENRIVTVYLFGSSIGDACKKSSDVDLAFLVDEKQYLSDPLEATSPAHVIAAKPGMALDKETDVTILNSASLEIAYEVVATGRCLYAADADKRLEYESKIRGLYFDFIPFIRKLRSETLGRQANPVFKSVLFSRRDAKTQRKDEKNAHFGNIFPKSVFAKTLRLCGSA